MSHEMPLLSTIVIGLVLAFAFGALAHRLRISPIVGYLVAGIIVGPFTPGYVADQTIAHELAEIGVILLMFGVGLHSSLDDLLSVRAIAIPGAVVQIAVATALGMGCSAGRSPPALSLGWRFRWPAPLCCCARCENGGCSRPNAGASRSDG
jgi:CPA2 family monovalent cation:H+ antiporter-2